MDKEDVLRICTMECYSAFKKNIIMPFAATWMDLEIILSKVSQIEKDKYTMLLIMWNLKQWYKWTYLQNRNRLTDTETNAWLPKEGGGLG